ncbi:MAG TPA: methyltransferase domain-containing protein [Herpetosiphonaceae bacterium]
MKPEDRRSHNPPYARLIPLMLPVANPLFRPLRLRAVQRLALHPGAHVLDVGCGAGSSFSYLRAAVGPDGRVVGVDISPYLAAKARQVIDRQGWHNVQVIVAAADAVQVVDRFDGVLLFAAHEVLTAPAALDNLLAQVNDHARVVAFGAKQVPTLPGALLNPAWRLASRTWLAGAAPIDAQPWRILAQRITSLDVEEYGFGVFYLVSGTVSLTPHRKEAA